MIRPTPLPINFSQGLDTKTDPKQVPIGRFLALQNTVFDKGGLLQKRNGFQQLSTTPTLSNYLTTLNDNLTTVGSTINAYESGNMDWVSKGTIAPMSIDTLPLIRNSVNQTQCDSAIAYSVNLICTAYSEFNGSSTVIKYVIADVTTGQNIVSPAVIPVASGVVTGSPRVFQLGQYFVIVFTNVISAVNHLQYVAISITNPTMVTANTDITSTYVPKTTLSWDGTVIGSNLYLAYNTTTGGQQVKATYLTSHLALVSPIAFLGSIATMMSICGDITNPQSPIIYFSWYDSVSATGFTAVTDKNLNLILNPVEVIPSGAVLNLASAAQNGTMTLFYELSNNYSYDSGVPSHFINSISVTPLGTSFHSVFSSGASTITASSATGLVNGMYLVDNTTTGNIAAGTTFTISGTTLTLSVNTAGNSASSPGDSMAAATLSSAITVVRSVGLASKAFIVNGSIYFLSAYQSAYQSTYFMINGTLSTAANPIVVGKNSYSNGGGYLTVGLPGVSQNGNLVQIPHLFSDLIQAVNKGTNLPAGTQVNGIYAQKGIELGSFEFGTGINTAEIAGNLQISGGFLWAYDGYLPVEHNFFLWPDNVEVTESETSGSMAFQQYFYQVTYEWADNQGNLYRSAPSIPVTVTLTDDNAVTINVPTLRLTYKTANPLKIVIYRWSVAQQVYYQVTSITAPTLNDTTVDSISFTDTLSDATILGNNILYTNGGVLEDVNAPATNLMTLFDTRLWLVDAEDQNLLWFSKQVIESTPVEMSDLLTLFIPPTTAAQGSTGVMTAIAPMDDKLIIFKKNAMYYINGAGPDNTGSNSQYSQPIFITSTVGCSNQNSIVFMNEGLMFQSTGKGIWLLGRDLSVSYIGAPVEDFNGSRVESALNVPETNQVRFTLDTGETLMFDYYYKQWSTFVGIPGVSSCVYQDLHTFINALGQIYQETPGVYLDGTNPVLISFTTNWINLAGVSGYQRIYEFSLLGTYLSPMKINIGVAYNFHPAKQQGIVNPQLFSGPFGSDDLYGQSSPFGGQDNTLQWRVQTNIQKCQTFQITATEVYDPSFGVVSGAGFNLSAITCVLGILRGYRPFSAAKTGTG